METPGRINKTMSLGNWALIAMLSIIWGGSFFFIGVAVKGLPPFTIVGLRVGIAALALHVIIRATHQRMPFTREAWVAFFGMGFLNNLLPFCLIVWGQTRIASDLASILNATPPLFAIIFRVLAPAGVTNIMLVIFLTPVSAVLLGVAFLGEHIQIKHLVGMGLIGLGLAAIDGRIPGIWIKRGRYGGPA
jgi:drug/metabolite transporter (DMT)-like permease